MSAAGSTLAAETSAATENAAAVGAVPPKRGLIRKYALLLIALVGATLLVTSGFEFWFSYQENKATLIRIQQEKADAAAARIRDFVEDIQRQIGWTTHAQWAAGPLDQRRQDYFRLLRQVPPITELTQLDGRGREQLKVSRLAMDAIGSEADFSQSPAYTQAKVQRVWFSPVYFRKQSEPYVTLAVANDGRNAGVTVAEINLKLIQDVIAALRIGQGGYAYVLDGRGRLIAHPDISLVLRDTNLSHLPQVAAAVSGRDGASSGKVGRAERELAPAVAQGLGAGRVLTAHTTIDPLGWLVFVEVPLREAFAPLYGAALRTGILLLLGLAAATLVALLLARRMTGPIRAIAEGAERLGRGELDRRLDIHTGDELEALAQQFNRMAGDLQKSYAELEQRVRDRTAELSEALDQQTATAEVLGVINASPGELAPVFDAMLAKAMDLCGAAFGFLTTYDGKRFTPAAMRGVPQSLVDYFATGMDQPSSPGEAHARILAGENVVRNLDQMGEEPYRLGSPLRRAVVDLGGARSALVVALRKDRAVLGALTIYRKEVRPFSDKEVALMQNFAAQAVIAMENARLITETREALEQQTATAEVLGVINSSPGDLAPVFDAMLERAMRLCEAAFGVLWMFDDERLCPTGWRGVPPEFVEFLSTTATVPGPGTAAYRCLKGGERSVIHNLDMADDEAYRTGDTLRVALVDLGRARTALHVPLCKEDAVVGVITLYRQEVRLFGDKQIALLQNFAAQAVIAMENARLITETREALEQQTATAEVLGVINSSPGDLVPVFDALLEKATWLCAADFGIFFTYDGECLHAPAIRGATAAYAEFLSGNPLRASPNNMHSRMIGGEPFVQIADAMTVPGYAAGDPMVRAFVDLAGGRTVLAMALRKDDVFLGEIAVYRREARPFSDKQIALLQNFAAQAVIAMENARLLDELRGRTRDLQESLEYQTATSDVLKVISQSTFDLQPVLQTVAETATRLCGAEMALILRRDGDVFRAAASVGFSPAFLAFHEAHPISPGRGTLSGRVALERRTVQIIDSKSDPEYTLTEATTLGNIRTQLGVPLLREGSLIGTINLCRQRVEPFTEKQIELVSTFADQAVIAIQNARLFNDLRERTDELGRSVEELKALSEVGQAVSSTLDLGAILSTILNRSVGLTGSDAGAIFRYRRRARSFRLFEAVGWDEQLIAEVRKLNIAEDVTAIGDATSRRAPLQIADLAQRASNPLRDINLAAGYRSALIVPLVGADRIFGAIVLQRRAAGEYPEATVRLMQTLAAQSVLAIQNARLFNEIAEKSEQLAEASRHKSQFLANMSHELRTPLNAILGYTELMVDGIYGELTPRAAGVLERVQNNGKHLLALINDVLDLAKIEAGQLVLTLEEYTLPDVVQSVVSATEGLATTKGLKFTAEIAPDLPTGHGDARRLAQVLLNLVGNAVKFTDAGEVAIRAAAENGNFLLTVRDTGPGIAPEDHGKIFEEFQQVDSSNTRKKGGTGLGLAISKRMVEMQGGTLAVDSELGKGATFHVNLPVRVEDVADELDGEMGGGGMTKRILVIEDTEDNRQIVGDLLDSAGYELIEAVDGLEGVATAEREQPDLILMDIQLPGIDGYEATRRIRAIPALAKVPIIAVTSYALSGDEAKTRAAGCDGYVAKPFSPRQLLAKIREFLP